MLTQRILKALTLGVLLMTSIVPSISANPPASQDIGVFYLEAGGCEPKSRPFSIPVPNPERIDFSHKGLIAGFDFVETTRVGRAGIRNVSYGNGVLTFELFAEGGGAMNDIPFIGRRCINPSGASIGYRVTAHYR